MSILVSAFISNINNRDDYTEEKYIENGLKLINLKFSKIIFLEKKTYEKYFLNKFFNFTHFVIFEKEEIYFYDYTKDKDKDKDKDNFGNFNIIGNKKKDTLEYFFINCHKTEWMKKAIEINNYQKLFDNNNKQYVWIDFGIFYIIKDDLLFEKYILNLSQKIYSNIRIASCWDIKDERNIDIYKNIAWYFCGGIFGGNEKYLVDFADLMKKKCLLIMKFKKSLMWEVNIWYLIYKENPELFDCYNANHDSSIIKNY
jgi:hypothetical protein